MTARERSLAKTLITLRPDDYASNEVQLKYIEIVLGLSRWCTEQSVKFRPQEWLDYVHEGGAG